MFTDIMSKKTRVLWGLAVFLFLIFADQFAKRAAENIFENYNFAFSLPVPEYIMYSVYFLSISLITWYAAKNYKSFDAYALLAWVLILAGAVSNVGERLVLGYVRDWIYIWTGVFNLADIFIILGIVLLSVKNEKRKM